jgi:hypothetical protein
MNHELRNHPQASRNNHNNSEDDDGLDAEEALQDLAQLAELHQEAERMKALGNKHMAAQVRLCYMYCDFAGDYVDIYLTIYRSYCISW